MRGKIRLLGAASAALVLATSGSAGAGSTGHDAVNFTSSILRVREGSVGNADVVRGTHGSGPATADVTTYPGERGTPASAGQDYTFTRDELYFQDGIDADYATIPIANDSVEEGPENITLKLENLTQGMVRGFPSEATMTIIDNDGPARTSFQFPDQEMFENDRAGKIRVYVIALGPITAPRSVEYTTVEGSAEAGSDYETTQGTLSFSEGESFKWVDVPLINNAAAEPEETFSMTLSPTTGGTISAPSSTTVTIHDEDREQTADSIAPYTAFHQPLHGDKYSPREIKSLIAFMQDNENGSGMAKVDLALRMNRDDGSCRWWNGISFREGACKKKKWADTGRGTETKVDMYSDTAVFTLGKVLKSSNRKSDIANYTAYCRGRDIAGNIQSKFIKGQNRNRFDITK